MALREINGKLKRSLGGRDGAGDSVPNFNGPFLIKSLIRWFGNVPLVEESTALETILLVLGVSANQKTNSDAPANSPSSLPESLRQ